MMNTIERTRFVTGAVLLTVALGTPSVALAQHETHRHEEAKPSAKHEGEGPKLTVWTCATHPAIRMPQKGDCPVCEATLTDVQVPLTGQDAIGDPYPLSTCPVSGKKLGSMGPPIVMAFDGREVRFCCTGCISSFEKDPQTYWKKIDEQIIAQQTPHYPLTECPVSGEALGEMGKPVDVVWRNRLVRLCCNGCKKELRKDPASVLAKLDATITSEQTGDYPLEECMVSGMALGSMGDPLDLVCANRLVRFCCGGCLATFWEDPASFYERLDDARAAAHEGDAPHDERPQEHEGDRTHDRDRPHDHDSDGS